MITEATVADLAHAILDPQRPRPIVVVTTSEYASPETIPPATADEADEIRRALGVLADVAIVATGKVSYALDDLLPDRWHVFGGVCRSYPSGIVADPDIRRSPLRRRAAGEVASELVIIDAIRHAREAGVTGSAPRATAAVTGTVTAILLDGQQALIDVGTRFPAIAWRDLTSPGIPLDWLIAKGSRVPGTHDRESNRFDLRVSALGAADFLAAYPHNAVTLALVDSVAPDTATLRVHPDLALTVHRSDVTPNPLDTLDLFFVDGDVVRVRVIHLSTGRPHLRLSDVDDDEPVLPAVTVVEGGTPWLVEGRSLPAPVDETPTVAQVAPGEEPRENATDGGSGVDAGVAAAAEVAGAVAGGTDSGVTAGALDAAPSGTVAPATDASASARPAGGVVQSMSMTIDALRADNRRLTHLAADAEELRRRLELTERLLRDTRAELGQARHDLRDATELRRTAVAQLRKARGASPGTAPREVARDRRTNWPSDEPWIRNEIERAWIDRVPASDKLQFPLPADYLLGPRFAESLAALDDGQFDKAMKCVVDVLTGRAKDVPGRELHRLRVGDGGGDATRTRHGDGAVAWRAAVELNTASARRLHYWTIGNVIELAQVGLHDDMDV